MRDIVIFIPSIEQGVLKKTYFILQILFIINLKTFI